MGLEEVPGMYLSYLVDEEHTRYELGDTLINVLVDDLVDLAAQLLCDLGLARLHELAHHAHNILTALWPCVRDVQIVKRDILHNILLLVYIALGHGHVLLGFQIEFCRESIAATNPLDCASVGLNVYNVTNAHSLLLDRLVDTGVQSKLLRSSRAPQCDQKMADGPAVASQRVLGLLWRQLSDFALVDLLLLLHSQANGATEVLHQRLGLLDFSTVHLATGHGAKGHLGSKLLADGQRKRSLSCSRPSSEQHSFAGHFLCFDQVHHQAASFSSSGLADEALRIVVGETVWTQAQAFDVGVCGGSVLARGGLADLADLDGFCACLRGGRAAIRGHCE
jgi:hypothetical protein